VKFTSILTLTILLIAMTSLATATPQSKEDTTKVVMTTNMGTITILLFEKESPISVKNFLAYVDSGFYGGLIFHRVIPGFMAQGGGFMKNLSKRQTILPPIKNEADNYVKNDRGTIAMARTMDPNSATSQFFINVVDNTMLNMNSQSAGYAVFGKVIEGMDVVDKIVSVKTETKNGMKDVPVEPVIIVSIKRK
jgi:peptidyl-prolyl cis-trans isomerase A (cyclophilin A)